MVCISRSVDYLLLSLKAILVFLCLALGNYDTIRKLAYLSIIEPLATLLDAVLWFFNIVNMSAFVNVLFVRIACIAILGLFMFYDLNAEDTYNKPKFILS
jgi:hypothetical protein